LRPSHFALKKIHTLENPMKKLTLTLVLLTLLLTACAGTTTPAPTAAPVVEPVETNLVTAEGKLLPAPSIELAFAQGGVVAEVLAKPGEKVAAGDVLARLVGIETVQAELAAGQLEQILAQQTLDQLRRNALLTASQAEKTLLEAQKAYEIESRGWNISNRDKASDLDLTLDDYISAEQDYRAARDKLTGLLDKDESNRERRSARADLDRETKALAESHADLLKDAAANQEPLTEKQVKLLNAIAALEISRQNQTRLDAQNLDPEKLAAAEARLAAATAHVTAAEAALELYELRAPFGGAVLRFDLQPGETVLPGQPVAFLGNNAAWIVETVDLAEIDIARVALGQRATVKLDAFPGEELSATVTALDPVGREYRGDMTYQVTLTLDQADARFMWNMTATVNIVTQD
jgi:multidrug resistance efflux pump